MYAHFARNLALRAISKSRQNLLGPPDQILDPHLLENHPGPKIKFTSEKVRTIMLFTTVTIMLKT